ncbi:MAG: bifunctional nicotinamidase/pyrazinamidase [Candidatus Lokiarchaeota archaeon]|nr:bifunctional nicotinamidase/pyrazinamidase [Candidatus Lokiarchaeota archaeon]
MSVKGLKFEKNILLGKQDALIVIDMQNDFIPGGALPVEGGDEIIDGINDMMKFFKSKDSTIVLSQDWHPKGHLSFASNHPNKNPGDEFQSEDGAIGPILWPDHCVQGKKGANFHRRLRKKEVRAIIRKGINPLIDSYSVFLENDKRTETGLSGYLKTLNITRIFICGLALDYCCYFSAIDGISLGFDTYFLIELTKGIDQPQNNISNALNDMKSKGVKFVKTTDLK